MISLSPQAHHPDGVTFRNRMFSAPIGGTDITNDGCIGPRQGLVGCEGAIHCGYPNIAIHFFAIA